MVRSRVMLLIGCVTMAGAMTAAQGVGVAQRRTPRVRPLRAARAARRFPEATSLRK